ncbi:MAG: flagellar hook assembly protein FlgD [Proteobacteria bacterium]|nr:flagellar hook assembly protein FlgD [Pseudomonadota bacterium]MBU1611294.1 flagellar hook assembly protein FlgD [Pseudomonadota bacterium]
MGYSNAITGQYEIYQAEQEESNLSKSSMDKDAFLTLLLAQLTNQDPLNPMEDTEMTSQLAEYSSLEQLTNLNESMDTLVAQTSKDDMFTAVSFIGKTVKAEGYAVTKAEDSISTLHYSLGEAVSDLTVNIYSPDGDIVRTEILGTKQPGTYEYKWDGKNEKGVDQADGTYSIGILAYDTTGRPVIVQTEVSGEVKGVITEDGVQYLRLDDGRYINFGYITEVVAPDATGTTNTTTTTD